MSTSRARLEIVRPARYRDRAVRYVVWIDGVRQKPLLQGNSRLAVDVEVGLRDVTVATSSGRWANAVTVVLAEDDAVRWLLLPRRVPFRPHRPPLVVDAGSGVVLRGRLHKLDRAARLEVRTSASHLRR